MVEPFHLQRANGNLGIRPKIHAFEMVRHAVRPWPHQNPVQPAGLLQRRIGLQIALDEVVVPSAHREHRNAHLADLLAGADGPPEGIERRMVQGVLEHGRRSARGGHIDGAQRQVQNVLAEIRLVTGGFQVLRHPLQAVSQLHGPALGVEPVQIIVPPGDHRKNGLQMGIAERGRLPLHNAAVGSADHPDLAVRPGLPGDPVQRIVAVRGFLAQRIEDAFRFVAPSHVLRHHGVAALHERLVVGRDVGAFTVGSALQDSRKTAALGGEEDVGGEPHAIAHGDLRAQPLDNLAGLPALLRVLRGEQRRAAGRDHPQWSHNKSQYRFPAWSTRWRS